VRQLSKGAQAKTEPTAPGKSKKVKMPKPAWAMTQETAEVIVGIMLVSEMIHCTKNTPSHSARCVLDVIFYNISLF